MTYKLAITAVCSLILFAALATTGCVGVTAPAGSLGVASIPIPVAPYFQNGYEDLYWENLRYNKVAIMGPVCDGHAVALDPPSDDQVMRALDKARPVAGSFPFLETVHRTNIRITKELLADYLDPPQMVPLVGPAQLHHAHYKCTVYFVETINIGWPIPQTLMDDEAQEVIYIDMDHYHRVGGPDES